MHKRLARVERNIQDWNRVVIKHESNATGYEERLRLLKEEGNLYNTLL